MIKRLSLKRVFLRGVYDPRINQVMWLSLATGMLYLLFWLVGREDIAIFAVLAIFPSLIANIDKPGPRFSLHLLKVAALFFLVAFVVLLLAGLGVPLALIFFPLLISFGAIWYGGWHGSGCSGGGTKSCGIFLPGSLLPLAIITVLK